MFDDRLDEDDTIEIPVQINGKLRGKIIVPADTSNARPRSRRRRSQSAELLAGKTIVKTIVVPGRLVNFVVK